MARQGGLNGNLGGLQVAHFPHHDDVRVLAQEGAQRLAEGQPDGFVDGHLHDPFDVVFDRVLGGEQLRVNGVDAAQAGIKGGGLAATGRAGGDDNAVGPLNGFDDVIVEVLGEAQRFDFEIDRRPIEHAQHDRFAELRGQRRDAQIDDAVAQRIADAPVLRQAALRDVQVGHDLEARNHGQGQLLGRRRHLVEGAVHAIADLELSLERLEVNVAGAVLDGLEQDQVDEPDDRGLVGQPRHHRRVIGDCRPR